MKYLGKGSVIEMLCTLTLFIVLISVGRAELAAKEREREERIRRIKEQQEEERRRKLEELKQHVSEQQH